MELLHCTGRLVVDGKSLFSLLSFAKTLIPENWQSFSQSRLHFWVNTRLANIVFIISLSLKLAFTTPIDKNIVSTNSEWQENSMICLNIERGEIVLVTDTTSSHMWPAASKPTALLWEQGLPVSCSYFSQQTNCFGNTVQLLIRVSHDKYPLLIQAIRWLLS